MLNTYTPVAARKLQENAVEGTRLGIPLIFGYDVIHGHRTIFPMPLGLAATWDLEAIKKSARIAAEEASADGLNWVYSPVADISRDPCWGRIAEGSGKDTWYSSQVARVMVEGYQGDDFTANNTVMACAKHLALYGAAEADRDYNTVDMSKRRMFEDYLPPYKAAIDAGAETTNGLAWVIIGGLTSSLLLILVLVPAAYMTIEGAISKIKGRFGKHKVSQKVA